jgi:hypothetical protein
LQDGPGLRIYGESALGATVADHGLDLVAIILAEPAPAQEDADRFAEAPSLLLGSVPRDLDGGRFIDGRAAVGLARAR